MQRVLVILVALAGVVFADDTGAPTDDWSPIVYPAQRLPIVFSHAKHLARGATCAGCHRDAAGSRSAVDNLLPTEIECRACHAIERDKPDKAIAGAPPARCAACHPGWTPGAPVQQTYRAPTSLKFAHAAHHQPCTSCHRDLTRVDLATRAQLPTMASCFGCHKDGATPARCGDCHMRERGGLLETEFPHGTLVPRHTGLGDAHGPSFAKDHRQEATQVDASCTACHDRSTCLACHQGVTKPTEFHPGNYALAHAIEARRGTPDCSACHRAQSFCIACHERAGLGMRGEVGYSPTDPARAFHPASWVSTTGGANRHAGEARRNIVACASCHRENDCVQCHSAEPGKLNASPHPKGWRASSRCRALDRGNRRMCLRCHITQDEVGCDWRAQR